MTRNELNKIETILKELSRNMKEKYANKTLDFFDVGYCWAINDVWEALNKTYNNDNRTIQHKED